MHIIHIMDAKEEDEHFQAVKGVEQSVKFVTCCRKYDIGSDLEYWFRFGSRDLSEAMAWKWQYDNFASMELLLNRYNKLILATLFVIEDNRVSLQTF
jgi:hypothetical protein